MSHGRPIEDSRSPVTETAPDINAPVTQTECLTSALKLALKSIEVLTATLAECEAYFDNRADVVDGDYGVPEANEEMRLLSEIREVNRALR